MIKFDYSGVIELTPPTGMALMGAEGAKTTDFGDASECYFEFFLREWEVRMLIM